MKVRWLLWMVALGGCSTLADTGGGDVAIPNARAGPFREIETEELGQSRAAPYALRDDDDFLRDASVIDVDGDAASFEVHAYAARTVDPNGDPVSPGAAANEIVRFVAVDGRSFARASDIVLTPEAVWEGSIIGKPAALRVDDEVWLYYAAEGGIGLAISSDGVQFARVGDAPLLAAGEGWEQDVVPTSPAVLQLADGSFQMFYESPLPAGSAIGEARSSDGLSWQRYGLAPALAPGDGHDAGGAGSPHALLATSAQGRFIQYLYYGAVAEDGRGAIGLAARYGTDGGFQRSSSPVFGGSLQPREPCVLRYDAFSLLFFTEKAGSTSALDYPAVAVGVAPADVTLPPRDDD